MKPLSTTVSAVMANIIHIVHRYPPARGGAENHVCRLGHFLTDRGHRVRVETTTGLTHDAFVRADSPHLKPGTTTEGPVQVRRHDVLRWPGQRILLRALETVPLPEALQPWLFPWGPICPSLATIPLPASEKPDAVHAFAFPHGSIIAAAEMLARRYRARFILTPFWHPGPKGPQGERIRHGFNHPALLRLARRADMVIAQTVGEKEHLTRWGLSESAIEVAPPGIAASSVSGGSRFRGRKQWGLPDQAVVVGHLGPICRNKGSVALLETLGKLQHENIFGLLAGTVLPDAQSSVTNRSSNARIMGPLTEQERRDFYASIDLFCLPSVIDSFGLVLLEAWSAGVPCVVFGAGGPGSIVRHGVDGLIIPESDSHYLESALAELCRSAETRKTMGNAGTLRVLTEFTEEKRYSHLARLIESTLHNRKY